MDDTSHDHTEDSGEPGLDRVKRLKALVDRLRQDYRDDPNIKAIGWGSPTRGGQLADELAVVFFVRQKAASERSIAALGSTPIPPEIDGFPTDVQAPRMRPAAMGQRNGTKYDPLRGGIATSNSEGHIVWFNGYGTLGLLARDNTTGDAVALSNWHVWGDGASMGDQIIQPGRPTGAEHAEAIGKVLACGPLLTSLIEWESPDPLAAGLYGGAAAAAVAAAASDYRDPTRRGQDATLPPSGDRTLQEKVDVGIEYPDLPLPGVPFRTKVTWDYERHTESSVLAHSVSEDRANTQFLLGKMVTTDRSSYLPGDTVQLLAAVWDWQPRSCGAYHVVAHLIPHRDPRIAYRSALSPTACPRKIPLNPPDGDSTETVCVDMDDHDAGQYPSVGSFAWLRYASTSGDPIRLVDWYEPERGLQLPHELLQVNHPPAVRITTRIVQFHSQLVTLTGLDAAGGVVDQVTSPTGENEIHELTLRGPGIVQTVFRGGAGEALLLSYCIDPTGEESVSIQVKPDLLEAIKHERPDLDLSARELKARRCCFAGSVRLPPDEPAGRWDVHLTVQNVNDVPDGTKPEQAATTIGGHLLSSHAEAAGCAAVMLLDHAFDVI